MKSLFKKHKGYRKFAAFLKQESAVAIKDNTIRNLIHQLEAMRNKYGLDLEKPNTEAVLEAMQEAGIAVATINLRRHALKMWLGFKGLKVPNKKLLKGKRVERVRKIYPKDLLTLEDLENITSHTNSPALRAYFWCLYDSAARPNALCSLNIEDVEHNKHGFKFTFRVTKTKQSLRTTRLLMPRAIRELESYLAVHPDRHNQESPLFVNRQGRRYNPHDLTSTLKVRHQKRIGKKLSCYLFRKSRATALLKEKRMSDIEIKKRLGHKPHSLVLEQYYAILDSEDQDNAELQYMGVQEPKDEQTPASIQCTNCGSLNEAEAKVCQRCKFPLTEEEMQKQHITKEQWDNDPDVLDLQHTIHQQGVQIQTMQEQMKKHGLLMEKIADELEDMTKDKK